MRPRNARFRAVLCLIGLSTGLFAGCGKDSTTTDIAGTVNFKGQPIVYGELQFIADAEAQHKGAGGYATVTAGAFDTGLEGQGVTPGPYIIRITAYPSKPPESEVNDETAQSDQPAIEPLFVGYEMKMDIQDPVVAINVPEDAEGFNLFQETAVRSRNEP